MKHKLRYLWLWATTPRRATRLDMVVVGLALLTSFYFVIVRPLRAQEAAARQTEAVEKLKTETITRQVELDKCLTAAQREADARWNAACRKNDEGAGCTLPRRQSDKLRQQASATRNACLLKYTLPE